MVIITSCLYEGGIFLEVPHAATAPIPAGVVPCVLGGGNTWSVHRVLSCWLGANPGGGAACDNPQEATSPAVLTLTPSSLTPTLIHPRAGSHILRRPSPNEAPAIQTNPRHRGTHRQDLRSSYRCLRRPASTWRGRRPGEHPGRTLRRACQYGPY